MGKKKGQVKTYKRGKKEGQNKAVSGLDNIEKGILGDGMNFKENDNLFEVGGEEQPSEGGVKSFALALSEHVGTEISGLSYSSNGSGNTTDMVLGKYKYNDRMGAKPTTSAELFKKYGNKYTNNNIFQAFHTHPDGMLGATESDPKMSADYGNLQRQKPYLPNASFIILYRVGGLMKTHDYTYLYNPKK